MAFYRVFLSKAVGIELTPKALTKFISGLPCGNGKHGYYRALRVLCFWLYKQDYVDANPILKVDSPKLAKRILPAVTAKQVDVLVDEAECLRDQCIVSLLFESGLRLSEVCRLKKADIDWDTRTLRVVVKGNREEKAMFGERTERLLQVYLSVNGSDKLFDLGFRGVQHMLERLGEKTGIRCNAHSFRRGFACELHKRGVSTLSIMHLGRWSSIEMVVKYTQSLTFEECLPSHQR